MSDDRSTWHMVAHLRGGASGVVHWESASWLWTHLRRGFPQAFACILMRDHLHLLARGAGSSCRERLDRILRHHGRRFSSFGWDVPDPTPVRSHAIFRRTLRYILLNPVRSDEVADPLAWPWSTARDMIGAIVHPWVEIERLRHVIGSGTRTLEEAWHRQLSVGLGAAAERFPIAATSSFAFPLASACDAAAAALRSRPESVLERGPTRRLFVQLARALQGVPSEVLAPVCNISPRSIRDLGRKPDRRAIHVASLCLGDERLRRWDVRG